MSLNTWVQLIGNDSGDGTAVTNTTTETTILSPIHKSILPAKTFDIIGKKIRVRSRGRISTLVTAPGTLTLRLKFGSIAVFTSGAMTLNIVAKTSVGWVLDLDGEMRSVGSGTLSSLFGLGTWVSEAVIGSPLPTAGGAGEHVLPYNTAPVVGAGFDMTATQQIDLTAQWSVANAANVILAHTFSLELMN